MRVLIHFRGAEERSLCGRTERSLGAAALSEIERIDCLGIALGEALHRASGPLLLVRAGCWRAAEAPLLPPPPSATGLPLAAIGVTKEWAGSAQSADGRRRGIGNCGGDLNRRGWLPRRRLPEPPTVYLEQEAAHWIGAALLDGDTLGAALNRLFRQRFFRSVHLQALDAHFDDRLRVLQVVTTIQIGGAERVTVDLAQELQYQSVPTCVAALGAPTRLAFPEPANFADLSNVAHDPEARATAIAQVARCFGADVVHAHLLKAAEMQAVRARGLPVVATIHNMPQSWPVGLTTADGRTADLLLACSKTVENAARQRELAIPVRTVWNGIHAGSVEPTPDRLAMGAEIRRRIGAASEDFVLVAVANPRRQKRLDRLPEIIHLLRERLGPQRQAHLLLAGAPSGGNRDVEEAVAALEAAIEQWRVRNAVHWIGAAQDIGSVLAASNALISASEFEGLSLAHLEALAAGLPVVATDVGGTPEIAAQATQLQLAPADAAAAEFVDRFAQIAAQPPLRTASLPKSFTRFCMAQRYRFFYARTIERHEAPRSAKAEGVWLITNNFSTGGAQSSARRLLLGLQARGVKVRAEVIQEHPDHPTPGRRALMEAGVPVFAAPPVDSVDPMDAVDELLARIHSDRPQAVVFWNLITGYKLLLADGLLDARIFDVSPGEMYFDSLARYFAHPRPGLPYGDSREYGRRLAGVIVKYAAEAAQAKTLLGAPVHVIRNGVALPDLQPNAHRGSGRLTLGTAARIAPQKRLEDLFSALRLAHAQLPPYVLRIAGGIETGQECYARELRRLSKGLPVEWCGEISDTTSFLQSLDIFLMISEPAGCPNASLEAMAAGLPVLATNVGGASEQVIHGETGLLAPRRDAEAFAQGILKLAGDPSQRRRLGANARMHVSRHFSLAAMVDNYARLFGMASPSGANPAVPSFSSAEAKAAQL